MTVETLWITPKCRRHILTGSSRTLLDEAFLTISLRQFSQSPFKVHSNRASNSSIKGQQSPQYLQNSHQQSNPNYNLNLQTPNSTTPTSPKCNSLPSPSPPWPSSPPSPQPTTARRASTTAATTSSVVVSTSHLHHSNKSRHLVYSISSMSLH